MALLELKNISKIYGELKALDNVSLHVDKGEWVAIMGPSGSGKSTMMNIIGCMDKPTKGEVLLDGVDISKESSKRLTDIRRDKIGLRKALGASDGSIRVEFLGEGLFLGLLGGVLGALLGFVFAQVVSVNVFNSSITFQPLLLPVTVLVSVVIAAVSCLMPIKRAVAIDPALVLKGE